jgi:hypothetical protein
VLKVKDLRSSGAIFMLGGAPRRMSSYRELATAPPCSQMLFFDEAEWRLTSSLLVLTVPCLARLSEYCSQFHLQTMPRSEGEGKKKCAQGTSTGWPLGPSVIKGAARAAAVSA